jgi:hypothetical protein
MIRRLLVAAVLIGAFAATPANACMRDRTPSKLVLVDQSLEKTKLSADKIAEVKELRTKASGLSMERKYREAENAADSALRILKVKWQEPKTSGPPTRC